MAYNPNETAEEFVKRVLEQQGGKPLSDTIAPLPAKAAEAAVPLNRAGGESLGQGQGTEMTYGEAMTRAAQYGHVPSQIGGGQPFNQAGGGPATMDQLNNIKGIWGIPTENGWVELGTLPDVTAKEAWTRSPSAARAAPPRNAPGSWVQDPATWRATTPGGKQIVPVDPNFPLTKGFTTRPGVPGAPAMGGAAPAFQPQGIAARAGGVPPSTPSTASAGGPVVQRGMAGLAQQAQVQPNPYWLRQAGVSGPMSTNAPTPVQGGLAGIDHWINTNATQALAPLNAAIGRGNTAINEALFPSASIRQEQEYWGTSPADQPARYTFPNNARNTGMTYNPTVDNAIDIPNHGIPKPAWARAGGFWKSVGDVIDPSFTTDMAPTAIRPTSSETQAGSYTDNWFTPGAQFERQPRYEELAAQIYNGAPTPSNWSGGGGVQPWMKPPQQLPSGYNPAIQAQHNQTRASLTGPFPLGQPSVQAGSQPMTPPNLPPWYTPPPTTQPPALVGGMATTPPGLSGADFATPQPFADWNVRRSTPPMATIINIQPGAQGAGGGGGGGGYGGGGYTLPSYGGGASVGGMLGGGGGQWGRPFNDYVPNWGS